MADLASLTHAIETSRRAADVTPFEAGVWSSAPFVGSAGCGVGRPLTTQRLRSERTKSVVPTTMKTANIAPMMARFAGALDTSARTPAGWKP